MSVKDHKDRVASLGCLICGRPAELHHPRFVAGASQRASDWLVIPLCAEHHRTGGHGVALHAGQRTFELNYGTEAELLARTFEELSNRYFSQRGIL